MLIEIGVSRADCFPPGKETPTGTAGFICSFFFTVASGLSWDLRECCNERSASPFVYLSRPSEFVTRGYSQPCCS